MNEGIKWQTKWVSHFNRKVKVNLERKSEIKKGNGDLLCKGEKLYKRFFVLVSRSSQLYKETVLFTFL